MKFVAYFRVSTTKQGESGLGLDSQRGAVADYVARSGGGQVLADFTDIESGSNDNRPELLKALRKCRLTGATLLIAKLDRLSRNRRFLMELADSKLNFVAVDMPEANSLTVGILACMADYERQLISERTKAALRAAKERGTVLGNPNLQAVRNSDTSAASAAWMATTKARQTEVREVCLELIAEHGNLTTRKLADHLNGAGYKTVTGKQWSSVQVWRIMAVA
jgi:DNA invertase Pin-like site-specific DNA recombinase